VGAYSGFVCAADVNGDGKMDLISLDVGRTLTVLTNNGSGSFGSNATYTVGNQTESLCATDVNGDGKVDLIIANYLDSTLMVMTNNGSGDFVTASTLNVDNPQAVFAADLNGDGKVDLISANDGDNTLTVLTNNFAFPPPVSTPSLAVRITGNGHFVSWPSASAGWSLQQNPDLTTTHWVPSGYSGYTISDDSTNKSLFIPSQPGNLFFRLSHP
jgi:hypothetical protein